MNSDKNFMPAPAQFPEKSWEQQTVQERMGMPAAPAWLTQPTLQTALIERIRGGGTLEEIKEYYRFMREIEANEAERKATEDFVAMQALLPAIRKQGEIDIGKGKVQRYMRWEDINEKIKPVLTAHGFALNFHFVEETDSHITMTAVLKHRFGHVDTTTRKLPLDKSGSKNIVQSYGSTQSYSQRYLAIALLNLVAEGEDVDATGPQTSDEFYITATEAAELEQLIEQSHFGSFETAFGIAKVSELPRRRLQEAKKRLANFKAKYEERTADAKNT